MLKWSFRGAGWRPWYQQSWLPSPNQRPRGQGLEFHLLSLHLCVLYSTTETAFPDTDVDVIEVSGLMAYSSDPSPDAVPSFCSWQFFQGISNACSLLYVSLKRNSLSVSLNMAAPSG